VASLGLEKELAIHLLSVKPWGKNLVANLYFNVANSAVCNSVY